MEDINAIPLRWSSVKSAECLSEPFRLVFHDTARMRANDVTGRKEASIISRFCC